MSGSSGLIFVSPVKVAAGLSLTGITALWSLSKAHLS